MKRKNLDLKVLAAEKSAITQFVLDELEPLEGAKTPVGSVFLAYKAWRAARQMPETSVSVDGFGRLLPHVYPRKSVYWDETKRTRKCILGVVVR